MFKGRAIETDECTSADSALAKCMTSVLKFASRVATDFGLSFYIKTEQVLESTLCWQVHFQGSAMADSNQPK